MISWSNKQWRRLDVFILFAAAVLLGLMPFVNHWLFRTYALDLGFYTHALFEYRQGRLADNDMILGDYENHLAGHFDLYLPLFAPLSFLFGTWTLLIIQWLLVILGGLGIRRLIQDDSPLIGRLAQIGFYAFYGVQNALAFDYHSNVIAAALLPYFFLALQQYRMKRALLFLVLLWIGKENMSLWLAFIAMAMAWEYRGDLRRRNWCLKASLASIVYFLVIVGWAMPALSNTDEYRGFLYSQLGSGPLEAIVSIVRHPVDAIQLLFYADLRDELADPYKLELFRFLLWSGGAMLIFRPHWLLMLIPILAQKLWHDNPYMWGIGGQYSVEFAPILIIGVFGAMARWTRRSTAIIMSIGQLLALSFITWQNATETVVFNEKVRLKIFDATHYEQPLVDVEAVRALLKSLPEDAAISAHSALLPHLVFREDIFQFPMIKNAQHLLLCPSMGVYPLSGECYEEIISQQMASERWEFQGDFGGVLYYRLKAVEGEG